LDDDIAMTINTARAELIRSGINEEKANSETDSLIVQAIKTYCLAQYTDNDKLIEGYMESFKYQQDCLRKSADYRKGDVDAE
jgi:hypothetical protein